MAWRELIPHLRKSGLPKPVVDAVANSSRSVDRAARAMICLAWVRLVSMTDVETVLATGWKGPKPVMPIEPVLGRTRDVIDTIVKLAIELHPAAVHDGLAQLPVQLDHGVPQAFAELATRAGRVLDRWDYQCLWRHDLCDVESILNSDAQTLSAVLGDDLGKATELLSIVDEIVEAHGAYARMTTNPI